MRYPRGSSLVVALALIGGCRTQSQDPVILALGDQTVRRSEFQHHVKGLETRGLATPDRAVRAALLEPFLEERVLVLEARRQGLLKAGASEEEEQAAVQQLLMGEVLSKIEVEDAEVTAYYRDHEDEFKTPETVVLRQVLVSTEAEALDIRQRLVKDPKSFESLAQTRSRSPEASAGGLMGAFSKGQLPPELEQAAFSLPVQGLSRVVSTPLGFHVLRLDSREPAKDRSLEECRGEIRSLLTRQKSDQAARQFTRSLMARAKVNHDAADSFPVS